MDLVAGDALSDMASELTKQQEPVLQRELGPHEARDASPSPGALAPDGASRSAALVAWLRYRRILLTLAYLAATVVVVASELAASNDPAFTLGASRVVGVLIVYMLLLSAQCFACILIPPRRFAHTLDLIVALMFALVMLFPLYQHLNDRQRLGERTMMLLLAQLYMYPMMFQIPFALHAGAVTLVVPVFVTAVLVGRPLVRGTIDVPVLNQSSSVEDDVGSARTSSIFAALIIVTFTALTLLPQLFAFNRHKEQRAALAVLSAEARAQKVLLKRVIPETFFEALENERARVTSKPIPDVSVIFCEVVVIHVNPDTGAREPRKLGYNVQLDTLSILAYVFKVLDRVVLRNGVRKVETIGSEFMAVSGLPHKLPHHPNTAYAALVTAMDMMRAIARESRSGRLAAMAGGMQISLQIGINSGPVVESILGRKMLPRWKLFGDTVNTASRMKSSGTYGRIHVSRATRNLLMRDAAWIITRARNAAAGPLSASTTTSLMVTSSAAALATPAQDPTTVSATAMHASSSVAILASIPEGQGTPQESPVAAEPGRRRLSVNVASGSAQPAFLSMLSPAGAGDTGLHAITGLLSPGPVLAKKYAFEMMDPQRNGAGATSYAASASTSLARGASNGPLSSSLEHGATTTGTLSSADAATAWRQPMDADIHQHFYTPETAHVLLPAVTDAAAMLRHHGGSAGASPGSLAPSPVPVAHTLTATEIAAASAVSPVPTALLASPSVSAASRASADAMDVTAHHILPPSAASTVVVIGNQVFGDAACALTDADILFARAVGWFLRPRAPLNVKGKGQMFTYFVEVCDCDELQKLHARLRNKWLREGLWKPPSVWQSPDEAANSSHAPIKDDDGVLIPVMLNDTSLLSADYASWFKSHLEVNDSRQSQALKLEYISRCRPRRWSGRGFVSRSGPLSDGSHSFVPGASFPPTESSYATTLAAAQGVLRFETRAQHAYQAWSPPTDGRAVTIASVTPQAMFAGLRTTDSAITTTAGSYSATSAVVAPSSQHPQPAASSMEHVHEQRMETPDASAAAASAGMSDGSSGGGSVVGALPSTASFLVPHYGGFSAHVDGSALRITMPAPRSEKQAEVTLDSAHGSVHPFSIMATQRPSPMGFDVPTTVSPDAADEADLPRPVIQSSDDVSDVGGGSPPSQHMFGTIGSAPHAARGALVGGVSDEVDVEDMLAPDPATTVPLASTLLKRLMSDREGLLRSSRPPSMPVMTRRGSQRTPGARGGGHLSAAASRYTLTDLTARPRRSGSPTRLSTVAASASAAAPTMVVPEDLTDLEGHTHVDSPVATMEHATGTLHASTHDVQRARVATDGGTSGAGAPSPGQSSTQRAASFMTFSAMGSLLRSGAGIARPGGAPSRPPQAAVASPSPASSGTAASPSAQIWSSGATLYTSRNAEGGSALISGAASGRPAVAVGASPPTSQTAGAHTDMPAHASVSQDTHVAGLPSVSAPSHASGDHATPALHVMGASDRHTLPTLAVPSEFTLIADSSQQSVDGRGGLSPTGDAPPAMGPATASKIRQMTRANTRRPSQVEASMPGVLAMRASIATNSTATARPGAVHTHRARSTSLPRADGAGVAEAAVAEAEALALAELAQEHALPAAVAVDSTAPPTEEESYFEHLLTYILPHEALVRPEVHPLTLRFVAEQEKLETVFALSCIVRHARSSFVACIITMLMSIAVTAVGQRYSPGVAIVLDILAALNGSLAAVIVYIGQWPAVAAMARHQAAPTSGAELAHCATVVRVHTTMALLSSVLSVIQASLGFVCIAVGSGAPPWKGNEWLGDRSPWAVSSFYYLPCVYAIGVFTNSYMLPHYLGVVFALSAPPTLLFTIVAVVLLALYGSPGAWIVSVCCIIVLSSVGLFLAAFYEIHLRSAFLDEELAHEQQTKTRRMLHAMLPPVIVEAMLARESVRAASRAVRRGGPVPFMTASGGASPAELAALSTSIITSSLPNPWTAFWNGLRQEVPLLWNDLLEFSGFRIPNQMHIRTDTQSSLQSASPRPIMSEFLSALHGAGDAADTPASGRDHPFAGLAPRSKAADRADRVDDITSARPTVNVASTGAARVMDRGNLLLTLSTYAGLDGDSDGSDDPLPHGSDPHATAGSAHRDGNDVLSSESDRTHFEGPSGLAVGSDMYRIDVGSPHVHLAGTTPKLDALVGGVAAPGAAAGVGIVQSMLRQVSRAAGDVPSSPNLSAAAGIVGSPVLPGRRSSAVAPATVVSPGGGGGTGMKSSLRGKSVAEAAREVMHAAGTNPAAPLAVIGRHLSLIYRRAEQHDVALLMFDLVGFTSMSAAVGPHRVVDLLDRLYASFDRIVAKRGALKVETIGDAMFVACGVPEPMPLPASARIIAKTALDMIRVVNTFSQQYRSTLLQNHVLQARIGIHVGSVLTGVIGDQMPRYQLFGPAVDEAQAMESSSEHGQVHASAEIIHYLEMQIPLSKAIKFDPARAANTALKKTQPGLWRWLRISNAIAPAAAAGAATASHADSKSTPSPSTTAPSRRIPPPLADVATAASAKVRLSRGDSPPAPAHRTSHSDGGVGASPLARLGASMRSLRRSSVETMVRAAPDIKVFRRLEDGSGFIERDRTATLMGIPW